jgi:hypothetical protein
MRSRARSMGNCDYSLWTTEELIEVYVWEASRKDKKNRTEAQERIKEELKRRFDCTLTLLDKKEADPANTYKYLIGANVPEA